MIQNSPEYFNPSRDCSWGSIFSSTFTWENNMLLKTNWKRSRVYLSNVVFLVSVRVPTIWEVTSHTHFWHTFICLSPDNLVQVKSKCWALILCQDLYYLLWVNMSQMWLLPFEHLIVIKKENNFNIIC